VRNLLGWSVPAFAGRIRAGVTPLGNLAAGEFVLFISYLSCGLALPISPFFLLLLEELNSSFSTSPPLYPLGYHLCPPVREVRGGGALHHPLPPFPCAGEVGEGKGSPRRLLLPDKGGLGRLLHLSPWRCEVGKLAHRLGDRHFASMEANDCLALPSDGPRLDQKQWRAKPSLALEFEPILYRIKSLATGGLTSMHVVSDFLKRQVTPLQKRARLCCWFTGSNDISRIQRGPGSDLS
jgi:hypothetical protein